MSALEFVAYTGIGAGAIVGGHFAYEVSKKGFGWGATKLKSLGSAVKAWWAKGKTELSAVKGDLAGFETRVAALETDVKAIKPKVGL
jgi:hypothetical protein